MVDRAGWELQFRRHCRIQQIDPTDTRGSIKLEPQWTVELILRIFHTQ